MISMQICAKANRALIWGISCIPFCCLFIAELLFKRMRIESESIRIVILLSPLCALAAIILGIGALVQISNSSGQLRGQTRAIIGIIFGALLLYLFFATVLFAFAFAADSIDRESGVLSPLCLMNHLGVKEKLHEMRYLPARMDAAAR